MKRFSVIDVSAMLYAAEFSLIGIFAFGVSIPLYILGNEILLQSSQADKEQYLVRAQTLSPDFYNLQKSHKNLVFFTLLSVNLSESVISADKSQRNTGGAFR